jgi:hypothetical protein
MNRSYHYQPITPPEGWFSAYLESDDFERFTLLLFGNDYEEKTVTFKAYSDHGLQQAVQEIYKTL